MTTFDWDRFRAAPIVGILRGLPAARLEPVLDAVRAGGLGTVEITMDSPDAPGQIRAACRFAGGTLNVGAGTVTGLERLEQALEAGAAFIVTPTLQLPVLAEGVRRGVPVFPGVLSPSEILSALDHGAALVKIFPADRLGPAYLRQVRTILPGAPLMPTGGVDVATLPAYRAAGAEAFGVGSPLFDRARIEAGDWAWLVRRCAAFREALAVAAADDGPIVLPGGGRRIPP